MNLQRRDQYTAQLESRHSLQSAVTPTSKEIFTGGKRMVTMSLQQVGEQVKKVQDRGQVGAALREPDPVLQKGLLSTQHSAGSWHSG